MSGLILGTLDCDTPLQRALDNILQNLSLSTVPVLYMTSRTDNCTVRASEWHARRIFTNPSESQTDYD